MNNIFDFDNTTHRQRFDEVLRRACLISPKKSKKIKPAFCHQCEDHFENVDDMFSIAETFKCTYCNKQSND